MPLKCKKCGKCHTAKFDCVAAGWESGGVKSEAAEATTDLDGSLDDPTYPGELPSAEEIELRAELSRVSAERDALKTERDELELTNNLIMDASRRAVDEWRKQDPNGRKLMLPDLKEHIIWAFTELAKAKTSNDALRTALKNVLRHCDTGSDAETQFERDVRDARKLVSGEKA